MGIGEESDERGVAKYPSVIAPVTIDSDPASERSDAVVNRTLSLHGGNPAFERARALTSGTRVVLALDSGGDQLGVEVLVEPNISLGLLTGSQAQSIAWDILLTQAAYEGKVVAVSLRDSLCEVSVQLIRRPRERTNE